MARITFNLETIGDPNLPSELLPSPDDFDAPANYKDPAKILEYKESQARSEMGRFSLSPLTGRIICFSYINGDGDAAEPVVSFWGNDEEGIVRKAVDAVQSKGSEFPIIVTYNGISFDVPFLYTACVRLGIPYPLDFRDTVSKYGVDHVDVYQYLSSYGVNKRGTLTDWSHRLGVEPPFGRGNMVADWYRLGDWDSIKKHCESNTIATDAIYLKLRRAKILGAIVG